MAINVNLVTSRNLIPKYTYFLVRSNSKSVKTNLPISEYTMYVFQNPVTSDRGISILTNEYTQEITPITDEIFPIGTFPHPRYVNQDKQPLTLLYKDVDQVIVPVTSSRTEML